MPLRPDLIQWCSQFPPFLTAGDLQYFFEELVTRDSDIYEFEQNGQRSVVFVFLTRILSGQGWVPLDLAAHVPDTDIASPLWSSLDRALQTLPPAAKGVLINLPYRYSYLASEIQALGGVFSHEAAHMVAPTRRHAAPVEGVVELGPADYRAIYELTLLAFTDSPDIVVPDYDIWIKRREHITTRSFGIRDEAGRVLGFCNLVLNDTFLDLRTLAVLPDAQGQGLGEKLLRHALHFANAEGKPNCELTVAVKNRHALSLYERAGFGTFSSTLSWTLPRAMV